MLYRLTALLMASFVLLSGCATMSKSDCLEADWYSRGVQDGQAGQPSNKIASYQKICGKHDISVDQNNYLKGHTEGIRVFCRPDTGYQLGSNGRSFPNVCPADLQPAFKQAYDKGYGEYRIRRDLKDAENAYANAVKQQESLEKKLITALAELYARDSEDDKAVQQQAVNSLHNQIQTSISGQTRAIGKLACAGADWYSAGLQDGQSGRGGSTYRQHVNLCEAYHPAVDQASYIQGQSDGLQQYCSYDNGFTLGEQGRTLSSLCRGRSAENLKAGHAKGMEIYNQEITLTGLKIRKANQQLELDSLARQILEKAKEVGGSFPSNEESQRLARELSELEYEHAKLETSLAETTSEIKCYQADWKTQGFVSGENGEVLNDQGRICRKFGIEVDTRAYSDGYQLGVARYCTFANGQRAGQAGREYFDICPRHLEDDFLAGYLPEFEAYQRARLQKQLMDDLSEASSDLSAVNAELDALTSSLEDPRLTRSEKLDIINEISKLSQVEERLARDTDLMSSHLQCLTNNWEALGKEHGSKGLSSQLRIIDCTRFGLKPDTGKYHLGLSDGLINWCTPQRGYDMAVSNEPATPACSKTVHRSYHSGYRDGLQELDRLKIIDELKLEKLEWLEKQSGWRERVAEIEAALLSPQLSETSKRRLRSEKLKLDKLLLDSEIRIEEIDKQLGQIQ